MANSKQLSTELNGIKVSLYEELDAETGFKRDITLEIDIKQNQVKLQKIGIIRSTGNAIPIIDNLIWILGTNVLQMHEDYPELFQKNSFSLELINQLQSDLLDQKTQTSDEIKELLKHDASKQTMLKYRLVDLIRTYIQKNDHDHNDEIYITNTVDHAFKACLNYIDDYDFDIQESSNLPQHLSLQTLFAKKHLKRLNNNTAHTITKLLQKKDGSKHNDSNNKKPWHFAQPFSWLPISYKGFLNIGITAILTLILLFLTSHLQAIKLFASAFSISNPFLAAGLLATIIILAISYLTQLTPTDTLTLSEFILKSCKSFLTMVTCLLVLIHFFYPYNFINLALFNAFGGNISLALVSSFNILTTVFVYILFDQIFTAIVEPEKNNNFPKSNENFKASDFLLLRAPFRNIVWQFFQSSKNRRLLYITLLVITGIIAVSISQQHFVIRLITSISTIFSISSIMAMLAVISVVIFATKLKYMSNQMAFYRPEPHTQQKKEHFLDKAGMITGFLAVMGYVTYIDFSLVSSVFSILGNLFNLQFTTVVLSSQFIMIIFLSTVPFLLPKNINLKEIFYKNPFLQAEHIFMELNEFYYLYGLRHPIVMMIFLGLFIVSFASFYNHIIPAVIAHFAYTIATSLINMHVGTELLAFTASLMIGNMLMIAYNSLTAGKRSYISKLSRFWEMYPLDILAGVFLTLATLNVFILIPYIQLHLGTVAMIGSLSFLFKILVISYDFYRDNSQKSFIASSLMMLLWPFLAIRQLMEEPTLETFYAMASALEKATIYFLLTLLYDIPFKIFLRIFEVMLYSVFNILISITKNYGIEKGTSLLINTKKNAFSYLDFFRHSAKTTIFTNRKHYRLWHLLLVIGLLWISFNLITNGSGLLSLDPTLLLSGEWFNAYNILSGLMHNPLIHGILFIQFGWTIISILSLALIGLTNLTHKDISFTTFKDNIASRSVELILCTITCSTACILLCGINAAFIPMAQLSILMLSLIVQTILTYRDYADGVSKMMHHCFDAGNTSSLTSQGIQDALQSPVKATQAPDECLEGTDRYPRISLNDPPNL